MNAKFFAIGYLLVYLLFLTGSHACLGKTANETSIPSGGVHAEEAIVLSKMSTVEQNSLARLEYLRQLLSIYTSAQARLEIQDWPQKLTKTEYEYRFLQGTLDTTVRMKERDLLSQLANADKSDQILTDLIKHYCYYRHFAKASKTFQRMCIFTRDFNVVSSNYEILVAELKRSNQNDMLESWTNGSLSHLYATRLSSHNKSKDEMKQGL